MFGIVRPCRHTLCQSLQREWMAHLCGLCLALRDRHGHAARLATNYDGLLVSVLTEAQTPAASPHRAAGRCLLRGMARAEVVDARAAGARLAAAASLVLAAGKAGDHLADGDGPRAVAPLVRRVAAGWARAGTGEGELLGFDTAVLTDALDRQPVLESRPGVTLLELTEPAETCVAAVFAHTAVLAGKPHNAPVLHEIGRYFGRLAHLLDAVEDLPRDAGRGAFNPLLATATPPAEARRLCDDAAHGIALAVRDLDLERRALVRALLVTETARAVARTFGEQRTAPVTRPGPWRACPAESLSYCTCGAYQPRWSPDRGKPCKERFTCPCDGCDGCGGCCDCCRCCRKCDCDCGGGCCDC